MAKFDLHNLLSLLWGETQVLKARQTFCEHYPQCPVTSDLTAVRTSVEKWSLVRSHCTFLGSLLQTVRATEKAKWPAGYILLVGTERDCKVLYLGNSAPKLLLLIDYRTISRPMLTVLGATAYSEPLSIGSAPTIAPTMITMVTTSYTRSVLVHSGLCIVDLVTVRIAAASVVF